MEISIENYGAFNKKSRFLNVDNKYRKMMILGKNNSGKSTLLSAISATQEMKFSEDDRYTDHQREHSKISFTESLSSSSYETLCSFVQDAWNMLERNTQFDINKFANFFTWNVTTNYKPFLDQVVNSNPVLKNLFDKFRAETSEYGNLPNLENAIKNLENNVFPHFPESENSTLIQITNLKQKTEIFKTIDYIAQGINFLKPIVVFPRNIHTYSLKQIDKSSDLSDPFSIQGRNEDTLAIIEFCTKTPPDQLFKQLSRYQSDAASFATKLNEIRGKIDREVNEKIKIFNEGSVSASFSVERNGESILSFKDVRSGYQSYVETSAKNQGDGFRSLLCILINLFKTKMLCEKNPERKIYLLLDEPGHFMHLDIQSKILSLIEEFVENTPNLFVIYSTHEAGMVNVNEIDGSIVTFLNSDNNPEFLDPKELLEKFENTSKMSAIDPILFAIGVELTNKNSYLKIIRDYYVSRVRKDFLALFTEINDSLLNSNLLSKIKDVKEDTFQKFLIHSFNLLGISASINDQAKRSAIDINLRKTPMIIELKYLRGELDRHKTEKLLKEAIEQSTIYLSDFPDKEKVVILCYVESFSESWFEELESFYSSEKIYVQILPTIKKTASVVSKKIQ